MGRILLPTDNDVERPPRHIGVIRIDRRVLASLLKLPEGTEILDVSGQLFLMTDEIAIKVEHPDLVAVKPEQGIPYANPWYRAVTHQTSEGCVVTELLFDGWHQ